MFDAVVSERYGAGGSNFSMDKHFFDGQVMPHDYNPGYIVLSYLVSFVGCWTTLELLHKRTGSRGYYNWYLLLASATSMGAVAIWSMHYIGNRAINMLLPKERSLQIAYSPGFTAGSFFLAIGGVGLAFYLFSVSQKVGVLQTLLGGFLTGSAVCGMHYMGQGGISNYKVSYNWKHVVGSAVIAVTETTFALGIFFYFKFNWTNNWAKRILCASILALAVSGMHWLATVGTTYKYRDIDHGNIGLGRQATVIVVLCLALGCCIALITFAYIGRSSKRRCADRAQQVVLACVIFDEEGKLMVTPEGLLPCRKIVNAYLEQSFEDVFDIDHPVFAWIYRVSYCWQGIACLLPSMRAHLRATNRITRSRPGTADSIGGEAVIDGVHSIEDFSFTFKQLFCVAAKDLADLIQEPLENLGVLFDEIMKTGTITKRCKTRFFSRTNIAPHDLSTLEQGRTHYFFGRGQLLFLVRSVSNLETVRFRAGGFVFASLTHVIPFLAQRFEVTSTELCEQLLKMQKYSTKERMYEPGVHLACFALRPKLQRGWDVLVRKGTKNLLPSVNLTNTCLRTWQLELVAGMDSMSVIQCHGYLQDKMKDADQEERCFLELLDLTLGTLKRHVGCGLFNEARCVSRVFSIPCRSSIKSDTRGKAALIAFGLIVDCHQGDSLNDRYEFSPSRLFRAQQHVYRDSPDHKAFARQVHMEFAKIAALNNGCSNSSTPRRVSYPSVSSPSPSLQPPQTKRPRLLRSKSCKDEVDDSCPLKNLLAVDTRKGRFGEFHAQKEMLVDGSEGERFNSETRMGPSSLGMYSDTNAAATEVDTFADELMILLIEERRKQTNRDSAVEH